MKKLLTTAMIIFGSASYAENEMIYKYAPVELEIPRENVCEIDQSRSTMGSLTYNQSTRRFETIEAASIYMKIDNVMSIFFESDMFLLNYGTNGTTRNLNGDIAIADFENTQTRIFEPLGSFHNARINEDMYHRLGETLSTIQIRNDQNGEALITLKFKIEANYDPRSDRSYYKIPIRVYCEHRS